MTTKPTIAKVKNMRGRIEGYRATIGPVEAIRATPKEAAEACELAARQALARLARGTIVCTWQGHAMAITPTVDGWSYWIDTMSAPDVRIACPTSHDELAAYEAALSHLAQGAWEPDADDRAFVEWIPSARVRGRIAEWIGFQREYTKARAAGAGDVEAHRLGCERAEQSNPLRVENADAEAARVAS